MITGAAPQERDAGISDSQLSQYFVMTGSGVLPIGALPIVVQPAVTNAKETTARRVITFISLPSFFFTPRADYMAEPARALVQEGHTST